MKIEKIHQAYFIGIKGVGMTMLAQFLAVKGIKITGSDVSDTFLTDQVLQKIKAQVKTPFAVKNLDLQTDLIIYTSAVKAENNPELAFIRDNPQLFKKIKVISYAEAMGSLFNNYQGLAVCGSHGKTTVSAWLGYVLQKAGQSPSVLTGSFIPQLQVSALIGQSNLMVAEVDEYQNKFQYFQPQGVILNNIDYDHPDYFKSKADYFQVFADFIKKIPPTGFLVANVLDSQVRRLLPLCRGRVLTFAAIDKSFLKLKLPVTLLAHDYQTINGHLSFMVNDWGRFSISLLGHHNINNALAVLGAALALNLNLLDLKTYLASFTGTARRAEFLGKFQQALIFDDYAHHPTEIQATLAGFRQAYPDKRLITVFHPHTFSRTKALFTDFVKSFTLSDQLIILDVYASAREKQGTVSSQQLQQAISQFNKVNQRRQKVVYLPDLQAVEKYLRPKLGSTDLLLLMGAGDVFRLGQNLLKIK